MKNAACIVLLDTEMNIVGVSRRNDHAAFGLPGGKLDENETFIQAAIRELHEETGLLINDVNELRNLYDDTDSMGYRTVTYLYTNIFHYNRPQVISPDPEFVASWITFQTLLAGPFRDYNEKVMVALLKYFSTNRS